MRKAQPKIQTSPPATSGKSAVLAYVPALHEGYRRWLANLEADALYIIDESLLTDLPRAERDVSRIPAVVMAPAIGSLGLFASVIVLNKETITLLQKEVGLHMLTHRHTVTSHILETYFPDVPVETTDVFLRWDMPRALSQEPTDENLTITEDEAHQTLLSQAVEAASHAADWWRQVGALIARDGTPLLPPAFNKHLPVDDIVNWEGDPRSWLDAGQSPDLVTSIHAEQALISAAAKAGIPLKGADLYVTTFPCPVCAKMVAAAGFKRCFFKDGYSQLDGARVLKAAGVQLIKIK